MKTLKALSLLALVTVAVLLAALPATDVFTGSDGTALTTYSASWTLNTANEFYLYSNELRPIINVDVWSAAHWNADAFDNNQYAQGKIGACAYYDSQVGPGVRIAASAHTGYYVSWRECNYLQLGKFVAAAGTVLGSYSGALSVGDVIRIEVSGTSLTVTQNGTLRIGPITDSSIASGSAGVMGFDTTNVLANIARIDNWEGGNLAGGGRRRLVVTVK